MKIQILKIKDDDYFIFVNKKLKHRKENFDSILKVIGEEMGVEIIFEKYPIDELFKLTKEYD